MLKLTTMRAWFVVVIVFVIDRLTKELCQQWIGLGEQIPLLPGLNLTLAHNPGASFSLLAEHDARWFFIGIGVLFCVLALWWIKTLKPHQNLEKLGMLLIISGAIGNLWDRIFLGYVIDFILLYYRQWSWPVFNVADSVICIGAVLVIWQSLTQKEE